MLYIQLYSFQINFIYKVTVKIKIVCALQKPGARSPNKGMTGNAGDGPVDDVTSFHPAGLHSGLGNDKELLKVEFNH